MPSIFVSAWREAPRTLPPGRVLCAIGDVHGCIGLLRGMVAYLAAHVLTDGGTAALVLIGDNVDRGPASLETLSFVKNLEISGCEIVRLLGNHDFFLTLIIGDEDIDFGFIESWLDVGGESTLGELGLNREDLYRLPLEALRAQIRERLPLGVPDFLAGLASTYRIEDYLFVHAGLDPSLAISEHDLSDLLMIREPFLTGAGWTHDVTVVHGHTIRGHEVLPHRIAIDTGAFRTGLLSCIHIEGDRMRWVVSSSSSDLDALRGFVRGEMPWMPIRRSR